MVEAEHELVARYHTEYSGIKLMMYLVAEFLHMIVASFLIAILFLGEMGRPVVGGQWHWPGRRNVAMDEELEGLRNTLAQKSKTELRWRTVPAKLPDGLAAFVPALVLRGNADPKGLLAASRERL